MHRLWVRVHEKGGKEPSPATIHLEKGVYLSTQQRQIELLKRF
jgi:hypothetical protein